MTTRLVKIGWLTATLLSITPLAASAGDAPLAEAARRGDRSAVHSLLRQKADVNAALGDGTTALHWAAYNDDAELVDLLIQAGANPRASTRIDAITPLLMACANGNPAIIGKLLKAGADPNTATDNGETALMAAATSGRVAAVKVLLDHGAQVNARESVHGQTALMFAAAKDRSDVIRALISRGADPKITSAVVHLERPRFDEDGNLLAERPAGANGAARRRAPRDGEAGDPQDKAGEAARTGTSLVSSTGPAPASAAAAFARRASALVLGGNTALTLAARNGHLSAVQALVEAGADVNQASAGDRTTPIVTAICNGHYDVAKFLLDYGADPNLASVDGLAALYATIDTQWAPVGWAPNPITGQERVGYLELMKALLDHRADPNARLTKKLWFRPTHHDECWIGSAGATPFWRAAQATDLAAMRLLIAHGADPRIATNEGVNALMVASGLGWNGNFSTQGPDSALDCVRYCLELGLDTKAQDVQGYTALAGAAYRGDNALVTLLVQKGARLDARTGRGWPVTDMANGPSLRSSVPVKHPETVALLLKLGAPPLTPIEGEEILGIIRRRPATQPAAAAK